MKRPYKKPYLEVESFQLDAAIAEACSTLGSIAIHHTEEKNCTFANGQFFNLINCSMDLTGASIDGNDTVCYHGPFLSGGKTFTWS